jgi:hypothetical protein
VAEAARDREHAWAERQCGCSAARAHTIALRGPEKQLSACLARFFGHFALKNRINTGECFGKSD